MDSNDLVYCSTKIYSEGKEKIVVKIKLNDEYNNGCQVFRMTANTYNKHGNTWEHAGGGCCHKKILKHWPEFKIFADLHLSDHKGAPLYAMENGFYFINEYKSKKHTAIIPKKCLRITDKELKILSLCEDKEIFLYKLYDLGIVKRWEEEAEKAIEYLEKLTGIKFITDSKKSFIATLSEEVKPLIEERISSGYYLTENIKARERTGKEIEKTAHIIELKKKASKDIKNIRNELRVRLYVIEAGLSDKNLIYFNHKNTAVFNWMKNDCYDKISQEDFVDFLNSVDYSKLPEGIKFEIK
jgi:hypothetical protein